MTLIPDDRLQYTFDRAMPVDLQDVNVSFGEKLKAAFSVENTIGSMMVRENGLPDDLIDENFNPWQHMTEEEKLDESFVMNAAYADTPSELNAVRRQIAMEREQRSKITGADGFAAAMIAGIADPVNFIPVGGAAWKTYRVGGSVLRGALATGAVAAGSAAAAEVGLQATQLERTAKESAYNVSGAFLLGGILGGGATALKNRLTPEVIADVERSLDIDSDITPNVVRDGGTAGAQSVFGEVQVKGAVVRPVVNALRFVDPLARGLSSESQAMRRATVQLAENPLEIEGAPVQRAVEQSAKTRRDMLFNQAYMQHREIFNEMRKSGTSMGRRQFNEYVAREVRNPGSAGNEYARRAAQAWDAKVYQPVAKDLKELGLLDPDAEVTTAARYLNRRWNKEVVAGRYSEFLDIVSRWLADSRTDLDADDVRDLAGEIAHRIMGTPDGVLRYDAEVSQVVSKGGTKGLRSPFKAREFQIPDEMVQDFLENDIEQLAQIYLRHTVADAELVRKFGGNGIEASEAVNLKGLEAEIRSDYQRLIDAAKTEKERSKIKGKMDEDIRVLAAMRDRIRGVYDLPMGRAGPMRRFNAAARNLNYARLMGGVVASSLPDTAKIVMSEGFMRAFGSGFAPLVRNIAKMKPIQSEARYYGIAAETITSGRIEAISDINSYALGGSKVERGLEFMSNHFGNISLMNQWNDMMKMTHALAMQSRVYDDLSKGLYDNRLSKLGLTEEEAQGIFDMAKKHGEVQNGARLFHPEKWERQDLAFAWAAALRKESDRVIIVPGQEKPLFMSQDMGKTLLQFRSFMLSSTQRTLLASLQGQERNAVGGMLMMISMGSLVYAFKQWDAGREISDDPMVWVSEGIDRSGALGIVMETSNTLEKLSGNRIGLRAAMGVAEPASRFASRSEYEAALGPTYGSAIPMAMRVLTAGLDENEWTESDTRAVRRLLPYQNLTFLRRGIDEVEKQTHAALFE